MEDKYTKERTMLELINSADVDITDEAMVGMVKSIFDSGFIYVLEDESPIDYMSLCFVRFIMVACGDYPA